MSNVNDKAAVQSYSGFVQHEHDCGECVFLGNITTDRVYDLYFHSEINETVIARWGSEGDYISGLPFADRVPVLAIALVRAQRLGLV